MTLNKTHIALIITLATLSLATQAMAQGRSSTSYTGVQVVLPDGDAANFLDTGFGLTGSSQYPLGSAIDFVFEGAWYSFSGKGYSLAGSEFETDGLDVLSAMVGAVYYLGSLRLGAKGGYFFRDLHEWDAMPYAEVALGRFSFGGEYKAFGKTKWSAAYIKFRWQK